MRLWLPRGVRAAVVGLLLAAAAGLASALTPAQALAIAEGDADARTAALDEVLAQALAQPAEGAAQALAGLVGALLDERVQVADGRAWIVEGAQALEAATGARAPLPAAGEPALLTNRLRRALEEAQAVLALRASAPAQRLQAVQRLYDAPPDASRLPLIDAVLAAETDAVLRERLARLRAMIAITAADPAQRLAAAGVLAASGQPAVAALLQQQLEVETDPALRTALRAALHEMQTRLAWGERLGLLFAGLSLGSILVLAALGLAITFGLMGVINMAHGELIMIGAYATFVVQTLFREHLPEAVFGAYLIAAIPVAFLASAAVGAAMERSVIRWLWGRPLETLLATWGISLILIQAARSIFGAQNVAVENPAWLAGGVQLLPNLTLPYNRIAIIVFTALVLVAIALLIARTRLGLFVRGVTQNRRMAACVGVDTRRIDTLAFALGAGVAGLAGCALSQVGNVGPDLGQAYLVDSFMVVVLGGVGQLAGTVYAGLGLGALTKLLEGWQGAVLAKIIVLLVIIAVIQKRPQGLFALKGRSAEA